MSDIETLVVTQTNQTVQQPSIASIVKPGRKPGIASLVKKRAPKQPKGLTVTFGADPECMILDRDTGLIVSSIPILQRDKHNPIDLGEDVKLFADNTLCEFNIKPAFTRDEFIANMRDALGRVQAHLGDRYHLHPQAAHDFTDAELMPSFGVDPREIGCTPSICMLREEVRVPTAFPDNMRTGSFHLHIGNADFKKKNDGRLLTYDSRHDTMKLVALYTGLGTVIMSKDETSRRRRAIYGRGHEGRTTKYGLEVRCGEPYPLRSPEMVGLVFDLTAHALTHVHNSTERDVLNAIDSFAVETTINDCDKDKALAILQATDLPTDLLARVQKDYGMPTLKDAWGF
jgi:hypothetical protein